MRTTLPLRRQPSGRKKCLICALALFLSLAGYAGAGFWGYDPGGLLHRLGWRPHQIGDVIDSFNGVAVYYNGPVNNVSGRNLSPDGYNLGQKHQCVEFVKRYYYEALQHKMPDAYGHAKDFFNPDLADGSLNPARNLMQYTNGGAQAPAVGDLLIFGSTMGNPYGHVAIVCALRDNEVEIIQQNPGPSAASRVSFPLSRSTDASGTERLRVENDRVLGWLRKAPTQ